MAQVPASSRGLPASGGTITGPLVIDYSAGSGNDVPFKILAGYNAQNVDFVELQSPDDGTNMVRVDSSGALRVSYPTTAHAGEVRVGTNLNAGQVLTRDAAGVAKSAFGASGLLTVPAVSANATLALGTAYQNTLGYDVLLTIYLSVTVNTSGVLSLGVGPTTTPTQQVLVTGLTATGLWPVPIYLPNLYYALLSVSGTITVAVDGQIAMPV